MVWVSFMEINLGSHRTMDCHMIWLLSIEAQLQSTCGRPLQFIFPNRSTFPFGRAGGWRQRPAAGGWRQPAAIGRPADWPP